jgi:hypothetical protein
MSDQPDDLVSDRADHGVAPSDGVGADDVQEARVAMLERVAAIESLPLASRADAFGEVHDELRAVLEGTTGDVGRGGR